MMFKVKVLIECREALFDPSQGLLPAFQYGEVQSISKGAFALLGNEAVWTGILISMVTVLGLGGGELVGSAFTLLEEKTASLSENAQFQPLVEVVGSSQLSSQRAGPGHHLSGKDDKQGQRFSQKSSSESTLLETLSFPRPRWPHATVRLPASSSPWRCAQADWLASGAGLRCSLSQAPCNCPLTGSQVPRHLHRITLCPTILPSLHLRFTDKMSVSNSGNFSILLPLAQRTECAAYVTTIKKNLIYYKKGKK